QIQRAGNFRRQRYAPDHVGAGKQLVRRLTGRLLNEFLALRAAFVLRNKRTFNMDPGDLFNRTPTVANRVQRIDNRSERRGRSREQKRCSAATSVIVTNGAKSFYRRLHRVPAKRAVNVKIDKTWREIISVQVDNAFAARPRLL